jgi:hypothetical protein
MRLCASRSGPDRNDGHQFQQDEPTGAARSYVIDVFGYWPGKQLQIAGNEVREGQHEDSGVKHKRNGK